ncbi:MAG: hypothetical protein NDJ89_04560 [Oligoflexia bacterium]|nr:hypothetical protein [Oligoflexia bacterium]
MKFPFNRRSTLSLAGLLALVAASGCNGGTSAVASSSIPTTTGTPSTPAPVEAPAPAQRTYAVDAAIFALSGLSDLDAASVAAILEGSGRTYELISSAELNNMTLDELARFGMIIVPGGYGGQASRSLTPEAREKVRLAVVERGVGYVGFCAGAFVAVGPTPPAGGAPEYGFSIIPAPKLLDYFYPFKDGNDDTAASLPIKLADGTERSLMFWGGPALPEISGGVIARYDDGTPAMIQTRSGAGFITLTGPHPEGPSEWKAVAGITDPDGDDFDIASKLFESTLTQKPLQAY